MENNARYISRPARKQKDFVDPKNSILEGANEYNIWYGKFLGDHWNQGLGKDAATDRCVLERDAGYTKADAGMALAENMSTAGKSKNKRFFCVYFARGMCAKGQDCIFYHRIPTPKDDANTDELVDCFGRQRHAKHRDDMDGVGSFMKPCRTLYIANLQKSAYANNGIGTLEEALKRHFIEWGEIEEAKVIHRLSIGFVRFRLRTSSEFAKEAMNNQALDRKEILQIRWAYDDPNPVAIDAIKKADQDMMYALLKAKGVSVEAASYQYPAEYELPETKRMRLDNGIDVTEERPELSYPNTDAQYEVLDGEHDKYARYLETLHCQLSEGSDSENALVLLKSYSANGISSSSEIKGNDKEEVEEEEAGEDEEGGWEKQIDDKTGATYYFNTATGESSWSIPSEAGR